MFFPSKKSGVFLSLVVRLAAVLAVGVFMAYLLFWLKNDDMRVFVWTAATIYVLVSVEILRRTKSWWHQAQLFLKLRIQLQKQDDLANRTGMIIGGDRKYGARLLRTPIGYMIIEPTGAGGEIRVTVHSGFISAREYPHGVYSPYAAINTDAQGDDLPIDSSLLNRILATVSN